MSKFLGFLLGVAVAFAGPAVFGVLAAPGGIELNAKGMALAYGIGALIFWAVVSYFSGAGALGAFAAFGTLVYCWLWIPNRTTNFLNDVPGVTTGMIEGSKQYTLNGVVPILTVISLVYGIQLIVWSAQRRRRERAEAERLQREQEAAQAEQEAAAVYPVAGSTYPVGAGYGGAYGDSNRYDDLFDEDPEPVRPRSQAEEQTAAFPTSGAEQTAQYPGVDEPDAQGNYSSDETVLVPTDGDETTQVPVAEPTPPQQPVAAAPVQADDEQPVAAPAEAEQPTASAPVRGGAVAGTTADDEQTVVAEEQKPAQSAAQQEPSDAEDEQPTASAPVQADDDETVVAAEQKPVDEPQQPAPQQQPAAQQEPAPQQSAPQQSAPQEEPVAQPETVAQQEPAQQVKPADEKAAEQKAPEARSSAQGAPVLGGKEQVGQQYRERMDDPEDTGELFISAFENPSQMTIRPAGA
ncbi:hypothetical protein ACIBL3_35595 [Kribbella sp. NPDC050124]|uniref:hypothetical protein n=1 Tax=Kribbella sp. NPDC050124 TaxID=3364114 RepID=UPI00378C7C28